MASSNIGLWKIAVDTANLADGHSIAAYLTSGTGDLIDSVTIGSDNYLLVKGAGDYAEDSAHVSGDLGTMALVVRNDAGGTLVSADGDYSPLQVDANGRLRVAADLTVDFDYVYAEDSVHSSGDLGSYVLAVRQDTLASSVSADGDYGSFKINNVGELYVTDEDGNALLTTIDASNTSIDNKLTTTNSTLTTIDTSLNNIEADTATLVTSNASILTELQGLSHLEDTAHSSGDAGYMTLAVRNDTPGSLVSADGDYAPLQVDADGNLRVSGTLTIASSFAEDSVHSSGATGTHVLSVRKDALTTNVSADGDYASLIQWSEGSLKTVDIANLGCLATAVTVGLTAVALPASSFAERRILNIQNRGDKSIFIGDSGVTITSGLELPKGASMEVTAGPNCTFYAISTAASQNVRVLEVA